MSKSIKNRKTYLKISMLSPERILELSNGEVETPETLNYRNYHPSSTGLFSEKIFGPVKDWECRCGKYKKIWYKGTICENCDVLVTTSRVRRERVGHIELGCNIVLPQYLYGGPSILATILDLPQNYLERIVFENLRINADGYWELDNKLKAIEEDAFEENAESGTDTILAVLKTIDIKKELAKLENKIRKNSGYLALTFKHRKEVLKLFEDSVNRPEWMISSRLLVLPPDLRPIIEFDGKIYNSEINDRYRLVIQRACLLRQLMDGICPQKVIVSQKRMIQIAVDALFDSKLEKEEYTKAISGSLLKEMLKKVDHNVDFSARGLVVPDASVDFERIGIPFDVATILFKPFIAHLLVETGLTHSFKAAFKEIDYNSNKALDALLLLEDTFVVVISTCNGRLIASKIHLMEGECFKINPSVYEMLDLGETDDSMNIKVFAQLSDESSEEALIKLGLKSQMISCYSEKLQLIPNYYARKWVSGMSKVLEYGGRSFISKGEVYCAYANGSLQINELVNIRCQTPNGFDYYEKTSLGRLIINEFMPQHMGIVNRSGLKNKYLLEHNYEIDENYLIHICENIYHLFGAEIYLDFLRKMSSAMSQYRIEVEDNNDRTEKKPVRKRNVQCYDSQFDTIRKTIWNYKLAPGKGEVLRIKLDYKTPVFQEFIGAFLHNRRIAGDIYDFVDKIASDGDIITETLVSDLYKHGVSDIGIYFDSINECGEYSEYAFGEKTDYNPFMVAVLAIRNAIMYMPETVTENLLAILMTKDIILCSEQIEDILQTKEGEIGRFLETIEEKDAGGLNFCKLKKTEQVLTKTYLMHSLLRKSDISISVRLLCLLVDALTDDKTCANSSEILCFDENTELTVLGEYALKNPQIDLDCKCFRDVYGKIDAYAYSSMKNEILVENERSESYTKSDGEPEDEFDDEFDDGGMSISILSIEEEC